MIDQTDTSNVDIDQDEMKQAAITLLNTEVTTWEDATCFVTERVAFRMRELIKTLRKNVWGIFNTPKDPVTGRDLIWVPLTESVVDSVVKAIDLDTKDINFRAKKAEALGLTSIVRSATKDYLDEIYFGEYLDEMERNLATDGTAVWKTWEEPYNDGSGKRLMIKPVDLLNFYIDPTARSIQETNAVIERALMTKEEIKSMTDWMDTEDVATSANLSPNDPNFSTGYNNPAKMAEVYERWGLMPKWFITGKKSDKKSGEQVEGRIVVSNLPRGARVHLIEQNTDKKRLKPYEEAWYRRVPGRWYGRGVAESVLMLQVWLNAIVNIRINRSYVSQLGIFKIRKGSGITPQMISRLAVNGAIMVKDPDDLTQLVIEEASQASYTDEDVIKGWAERVTSTFEVVTGEQMPSSTPATNAVLQARSANSQFVFVKKGVGMFLQRWLKRHVLPVIMKSLTPDKVVRITGEIEELRELDLRIANELLYQELSEMNDAGEMINLETVERERQKILDRLASFGKDRYVKLWEKVDVTQYDVQVYVTNEEIDKGVLVQNLVSVLQTIPNIPAAGVDPVVVLRTIFDQMGLDSTQLKSKPNFGIQQPQTMGGQMPAGAAQQMAQGAIGSMNEQSTVTQANTI